jgi:hypothetical protein
MTKHADISEPLAVPRPDPRWGRGAGDPHPLKVVWSECGTLFTSEEFDVQAREHAARRRTHG